MPAVPPAPVVQSRVGVPLHNRPLQTRKLRVNSWRSVHHTQTTPPPPMRISSLLHSHLYIVSAIVSASYIFYFIYSTALWKANRNNSHSFVVIPHQLEDGHIVQYINYNLYFYFHLIFQFVIIFFVQFFSNQGVQTQYITLNNNNICIV